MNQQQQESFTKLSAAIQAMSLGETDVYELVSNFASLGERYPEMARVASALGYHARDIIEALPDDDQMEYADLVIEMYRRTFFDETYGKLYGSYGILPVEFVEKFTEFVSGELSIDAALAQTGGIPAGNSDH